MGLPPSSAPDNAAALHVDDVVPNLPASENKRFYPALDGLRAIAVLMVFFQHYFLNDQLQINWGWTGVDFFFVLSGFLITGILYDTRNTRHRFRNFYARRTLRIFPLYYGVLLIAMLLWPLFRWEWHPVWILWLFYLGNYGRFIWLHTWMQGTGVLDHLRSTNLTADPFFYGIGHFWSLCVEEQFYLLWPLVVFFVKDRVRLRDLCIAVCILCLIARILCAWLLPQDYIHAELLYRFTPLRADALLLGGAIALMLRGPEAARLKQFVRPACALFITGFVIFELVYNHIVRHFYYVLAGAPVLDTLGYTLIDLFAGIVILLSLAPGSIFYRIFTIRPLRRLGQISYGFYVFHDIPHSAYQLFVDHFLDNLSPKGNRDAVALIGLAGTILLAYLSFRFFETPFLRLKDRFTASD